MASHSPSGPTSPLVLRIFLASPGDVAHERVLARRLIREDLAYAHEIAGKAELEVVAWDDPDSDSPMLVTLTPQEAIKRNLRQPADCDVVIAIFWARMGTPLPEDWKKSDGSRFLSGTEWEYLNAIETSMAIGGRPRVYVYRRSEKPTLEQDDPEFDAKREQWKKVESFFASFRAADGSIRASVNPYSTPEDFRRVLRAHLLKVFTELIAERRSNTDEPAPRNVTSPAPPPWQGSPFPGLRAFTPADAPIFFGRGRETDTLVELLADPRKRFVLVAAASGSGKSSLVAAGLLPRLRDNAVAGSRNWLLPWVHPAGDSDRVTWTGLRFTPGELGDDPFVPLAAKLAPLMASDTQPRIVAEQIRIQPAALRAAIDTILHDKPKTVEALVFVDQFEEALTVVAEHYRESFIDMLVDVAKSARVRVIATIRADFHHRAMEAHPRLSETIQQSGALVWLDPPSGYALAEMISAPAARAGLQFDPNLPQHICEEVERSPGALALLAFALHELYEARAGDKLTRIAYDAFGGLKGAISKRAEATFNALPHASQAVLPRVFSELCQRRFESVLLRPV